MHAPGPHPPCRSHLGKILDATRWLLDREVHEDLIVDNACSFLAKTVVSGVWSTLGDDYPHGAGITTS